jgi:EAL domain-containing protein (putative c-di-GMP-specific phosphodiesterase class I)
MGAEIEEAASDEPDHALPDAPRGPVLVVDDDVDVARVLQRLLEAEGRQVVVVHDGPSAARAVLGRPFDVVLSDIHMPGMSGVELLRTVREHDPDVPVILITGEPSLATAVEALALGALQYVAKPVSNRTLVDAVARASRMHRLARLKREALRHVPWSHLAGDDDGLEGAFDRALATMWMSFQPIVQARDHGLFAYEALMRASDPALPHPGAILAAAERLDRLPELGRRVRDLSAEAFLRAPPGVLLFVNLHTRDLLDSSLYELDAPLARLASRVVLELTERASLDEVDDIAGRVARLRRAGYRIAIDDLGAGYAGLSSFAALEPEIVKLDMSLVRNIHGSPLRQRLVGSLTALCAEMNMQIVAEGIETVEERDCVAGLACEGLLLQGYLFARPGPPFPAIRPLTRASP